jgi:hypothetical protein
LFSIGGEILFHNTSSSMLQILEKRRKIFQFFLQWIENHPIARNACAFQEFIGQTPSSTNGYASLR